MALRCASAARLTFRITQFTFSFRWPTPEQFFAGGAFRANCEYAISVGSELIRVTLRALPRLRSGRSPDEPTFFSTFGTIMNQAIDSLANTKHEERALAQQVQELVARLRPEVNHERRHEIRVAVPLLFQLTPLNSSHEPVWEDAITVVGKDLSRRGLSFFHEQPLTYRRAIISLEHPDFGRFAAEIDINWCRFTRPGWYESGGRLVRSVKVEERPPVVRAAAINWHPLASLSGGTCC
jgi:hypothetical protein